MTGWHVALAIRLMWWRQTFIEWAFHGVPWRDASNVAAAAIMDAYVDAGFPKILAENRRREP